MTQIKKFFAGVVLLLTLSLASVAPAMAGDPMIDAAKDAGKVGESISGYLQAVTEIDAPLKRKIDEINSGRRAVYTRLAEQQSQSLSTIARLSGIKLIEREESGRYILDDSGRWIKR